MVTASVFDLQRTRGRRKVD